MSEPLLLAARAESLLAKEEPELTHDEALEAIRQRIAAPYDAALARLEALKARIVGPEPACEPREPVYATRFGTLTFDQIMEATYSYAFRVMQQGYGFENPQEIEDCLQFGFTKLWRRLQREPSFLDDKPKAFVTKAVIYAAKRERHRHIRHSLRTAPPLPEDAHAPVFAPHSRESRLADLRIDLERALAQVAEIVGDDEKRLMALYYATTDVTIKDMQALGYSRHTLRDHTKQIRDLLRSCLESERGLAISSIGG